MTAGHRRRPRVGFGVIATAVVTAVAALILIDTPEALPTPPVPTIPGIDVSHYQGAVQWRRVRADGYRFVYLKATEGRGLVDRTYAPNARAAAAAGLTIGAYHFARPDDAPGDAIIEADAFLRVAKPTRGQLVPLLDLENAGTLTPPELRAWTRTWLERVQAATGVRPAIYAGSRFWRTHMGDTTDFVSFPFMWASHQRAGTPPAHGWAPSGWSVWQWSVCGTVSGIEGCVDLDGMRVDRARLLRLP